MKNRSNEASEVFRGAHKLPLIIPVLKSHRVKSAYVFGSVVKETFYQNSDIDLLIELEDGPDPLLQGELNWQLWDSLE